MRFADMTPMPVGVSLAQWDASYNNADTCYYNHHGRNSKAPEYQEARKSGRTRLLAYKILDRKIETGQYIVSPKYRSIALHKSSERIEDNDADFAKDANLKHPRRRKVTAGEPKADAQRWDTPIAKPAKKAAGRVMQGLVGKKASIGKKASVGKKVSVGKKALVGKKA